MGNFTLPDTPTAKAMLLLGYKDLKVCYPGKEYPEGGSANDAASRLIPDRHFQLAHRHKISLIDGNARSIAWENWTQQDRPPPKWLPSLDGSLLT